jgi:hypothetical protein
MLHNAAKPRSGDDGSPHDRPGLPLIDRRRFVAGAAAAGFGVLVSSTGRLATADTPLVAKGGPAPAGVAANAGPIVLLPGGAGGCR